MEVPSQGKIEELKNLPRVKNLIEKFKAEKKSSISRIRNKAEENLNKLNNPNKLEEFFEEISAFGDPEDIATLEQIKRINQKDKGVKKEVPAPTPATPPEQPKEAPATAAQPPEPAEEDLLGDIELPDGSLPPKQPPQKADPFERLASMRAEEGRILRENFEADIKKARKVFEEAKKKIQNTNKVEPAYEILDSTEDDLANRERFLERYASIPEAQAEAKKLEAMRVELEAWVKHKFFRGPKPVEAEDPSQPPQTGLEEAGQSEGEEIDLNDNLADIVRRATEAAQNKPEEMASAALAILASKTAILEQAEKAFDADNIETARDFLHQSINFTNENAEAANFLKGNLGKIPDEIQDLQERYASRVTALEYSLDRKSLEQARKIIDFYITKENRERTASILVTSLNIPLASALRFVDTVQKEQEKLKAIYARAKTTLSASIDLLEEAKTVLGTDNGLVKARELIKQSSEIGKNDRELAELFHGNKGPIPDEISALMRSHDAIESEMEQAIKDKKEEERKIEVAPISAIEWTEEDEHTLQRLLTTIADASRELDTIKAALEAKDFKKPEQN